MAPVRAAAYAKINLSLEVLGRRADGYHTVHTVLQTVDLSDRLTFAPAAEIRMECSEPSLANRENLAWRAAAALKEAAGYDGGALIRVDKGIPEAMGLGGGSSDAAAALVALNRLWGVDAPPATLEELARRLGSDVPFFLRGGTALATGRGDVIEALRPLTPRWIVLVCPDIRIAGKTLRLYSMLSPDSYTGGRVTRALSEAINRGCFPTELLYNVFEEVALDAFPGLAAVMEDMEEAGAEFTRLSGAGPALYTVASSRQTGERIQRAMAQRGHRAFLARTMGASGLMGGA